MLHELCFWTGLILTGRSVTFSLKFLCMFFSVTPRFSMLKRSAPRDTFWAKFNQCGVIASLSVSICKYRVFLSYLVGKWGPNNVGAGQWELLC